MRTQKLTLFGLALLALFVAAPAFAQPASDIFIDVGWFPTSFSTTADLSSNTTPGTSVDLEDDAGLKQHVQNLRLEMMWRFATKHRLELSYTSWKRDGSKTLTKPIDWGDKHFDVGASLAAENKAQFIKLAYHYSLVRNATTEFDVSGGFDTLWNKTTLEGEATITGSNGQQAQGFYSQAYNYVAPVPVLGIGVSHLITPQWLVRGTAEAFKATVNNTTGKVLDARGSIDWLFSPKWGAGLGYNYVGLKVERTRFNGKYDFSGPLIYFSYRDR